MRIIVDVMGGDRAPDAQLCGISEADRLYPGHRFLLVGDQERIKSRISALHLTVNDYEIRHTDSVITMEDDPMCVIRSKKDSSMAVGLKLLSEGEGDVFVSAGNTGALFAGATLVVRKLRGVQRPSIAATLPLRHPLLLIDSGANLSITDEQYEQFAIMGSAYVKLVRGTESPRVGLLNNGTEDCKGTEAVIAAYHRLSSCEAIRFVGNVEGGMAVNGACDVLVSDGFHGNIFLKTVEGTGKLLLGELKSAFLSGLSGKMAALMMKKQISDLKSRYDSRNQGGAPILGISKPVIKAHGSSDAVAFCNAIHQAILYTESGVIREIETTMEQYQKNKRQEEKSSESVSV